MEVLRESTTVTETGNSTISGPYLDPERTESIPLKGTSASSSGFFAQCCQRCLGFADEDAGGGLKLIVSTFFVLSAAVTVALVAQIYHGDYQVVPHGSVATDSRDCSLIGSGILKKKGNAVDAAVASTLCMGVVNPHITGLGGGGFMLVYDHRKSEVLESLDFRETAPAGFSSLPKAPIGPSTVGVPGLLRGLFRAHLSHGKLPWKDIVMPAANLARSGFQVPSSLVAARIHLPPRTQANTMLHDLLDNLEAGQTLRLPSLATTLEIIAEEGPDAFYNGSISHEILAAVEGSSLTAKDLSKYEPVQREPLHSNFAGFHVIVPGAPSGGPLLLAALDSMSALNITQSVAEDSAPLLLYRLARAIQQNYQGFYAESGDPDFSSVSTPDINATLSKSLPETVSSHVAAVDLNDLYVSVVSGHNSLFGSQVLTKVGFILNNALASFDSSTSTTSIPSTASPVYQNPYPFSSDANSTITIAKVGHVPEGAVELNHSSSEVLALHPSEKSTHLPFEHRELSDSSSYLLTHGKSVHSIQNTYIPKVLPLKRYKRFENPDSGPRAAIWGSSATNNGFAGGKRPISLATPVIIIETGQVCGRRLILGGSDAGVTAQVLAQLLVLNGNLTSSIEAPRVKLNSIGSRLFLEQWYAAQLSPVKQQQLMKLGLEMQAPGSLNPSINIVEKNGDTLTSHSDSRGEGVASRF